jgi:mycobactin lysine-N-oxygenase
MNLQVSRANPTTDLIVVGAGAKAAALAAKVHTLNTLGRTSLSMTIVEANRPAASWYGENGLTTGEEPLAISPIKDVGFPYRSTAVLGERGRGLDRGLLRFSWQAYLIDDGGYAGWVNAGSPAIRHRDYGRYLAWVLARATAGVTLVSAAVTRASLSAPDGCSGERTWSLELAPPDGPSRRLSAGALVLTGPGVRRPLEHDRAAAPRMLHADDKRGRFRDLLSERPCDIAIAGGGESALSCLAFLRDVAPDAEVTVYTPTLPMSRGESFLENRVFSDPDDVAWSSLDAATRRDFVKHCDRGVFDAGSLAEIACDERYRFVVGRVLHVGARDDSGLQVEYLAASGRRSAHHDYFVNCTGLDLLEQVRILFDSGTRQEIERHAGRVWDLQAGQELAFGRALELEGLRPRLHIPGAAGLAQGPGFANLGCLGLLSDRVLEPLLAAPRALAGAGVLESSAAA